MRRPDPRLDRLEPRLPGPAPEPAAQQRPVLRPVGGERARPEPADRLAVGLEHRGVDPVHRRPRHQPERAHHSAAIAPSGTTSRAASASTAAAAAAALVRGHQRCRDLHGQREVHAVVDRMVERRRQRQGRLDQRARLAPLSAEHGRARQSPSTGASRGRARGGASPIARSLPPRTAGPATCRIRPSSSRAARSDPASLDDPLHRDAGVDDDRLTRNGVPARPGSPRCCRARNGTARAARPPPPRTSAISPSATQGIASRIRRCSASAERPWRAARAFRAADDAVVQVPHDQLGHLSPPTMLSE